MRKRHLLSVLAAGLVGEAVLEIISWGLAPPLLGRPMRPALLVADLARSLFGASLPMPAAFAIHLASGLVIFPLGYVLFHAAARAASAAVAGLLWGVILWFVVQGILAPLAGRPFMLGFVSYTWAALVAHTAYALAIALSFEQFSRPRSG